MYYDDNTVTYLNGQWTLAKNTRSGLYQQSFHYGNAVFEGIRAYATADGTQILRAREHYERLLYSAKTMHLEVKLSVDELIAVSHQLLAKNGLQDAYIRPLVYTEERLGLQAESQTNVFMCAWDWSQYFAAGELNMTWSPYFRPDPNSCLGDAKVSAHYVNSILALKEAPKAGSDDPSLLHPKRDMASARPAYPLVPTTGLLYTHPNATIPH